eukprot:1156863-Pelagomonas_calceolata.AAC.13
MELANPCILACMQDSMYADRRGSIWHDLKNSEPSGSQYIACCMGREEMPADFEQGDEYGLGPRKDLQPSNNQRVD